VPDFRAGRKASFKHEPQLRAPCALEPFGDMVNFFALFTLFAFFALSLFTLALFALAPILLNLAFALRKLLDFFAALKVRFGERQHRAGVVDEKLVVRIFGETLPPKAFYGRPKVNVAVVTVLRVPDGRVFRITVRPVRLRLLLGLGLLRLGLALRPRLRRLRRLRVLEPALVAPRQRLSSTGHYGTSAVTADQSALMPADLITLAHLSVSSAMSLPKSAGEP
jgi:hypothetical protein